MQNEGKDGQPLEESAEDLTEGTPPPQIRDQWDFETHSYRLRDGDDDVVVLEGSYDGEAWGSTRRYLPRSKTALLVRLLFWRDEAFGKPQRAEQLREGVTGDEDRHDLADAIWPIGSRVLDLRREGRSGHSRRLERLEAAIWPTGGLSERVGILEKLWIEAKKIRSIDERVVEVECEVGLDLDESLRHTERIVDRVVRLEESK